jgi:hypothetical protein
MLALFAEFFFKTVCFLRELSESGTISQPFAFLTWRVIYFFFNSDKVKPINRHVGTEN